MDFFIKKYYNRITKVLLISFLFVTILSAFHFHNYNLLGKELIKQQNTTEKSDLLINIDLRLVCTVLFNYTKLHLINYSDLSQKSFSRDFRNINYTLSDTFLLLSASKHSYKLRAPPSI